MKSALDVAVATIASAGAMGQQAYEESLITHLKNADSRVVTRRLRVRSMRSDLPGERRVPSGLLSRLPYRGQVAVGAFAYRGADLVHRCDLRLPPASGLEILTVHDTAWLRFDDEAQPLPHYVRA